MPPLGVRYDVELQFRGEIVAAATHGRVALHDGTVIDPPRVATTEHHSQEKGAKRVYDYVRLVLRDVRLVKTAATAAGEVVALTFSDGTTAQTEWLSAVKFRPSLDEKHGF